MLRWRATPYHTVCTSITQISYYIDSTQHHGLRTTRLQDGLNYSKPEEHVPYSTAPIRRSRRLPCTPGKSTSKGLGTVRLSSAARIPRTTSRPSHIPSSYPSERNTRIRMTEQEQANHYLQYISVVKTTIAWELGQWVGLHRSQHWVSDVNGQMGTFGCASSYHGATDDSSAATFKREAHRTDQPQSTLDYIP